MSLEQPSIENLTIILDELKQHLGVANQALFDAEDYNLEKYEDLKFLYDHIMKSGTLSPQQTDAFIQELRSVRK